MASGRPRWPPRSTTTAPRVRRNSEKSVRDNAVHVGAPHVSLRSIVFPLKGLEVGQVITAAGRHGLDVVDLPPRPLRRVPVVRSEVSRAAPVAPLDGRIDVEHLLRLPPNRIDVASVNDLPCVFAPRDRAIFHLRSLARAIQILTRNHPRRLNPSPGFRSHLNSRPRHVDSNRNSTSPRKWVLAGGRQRASHETLPIVNPEGTTSVDLEILAEAIPDESVSRDVADALHPRLFDVLLPSFESRPQRDSVPVSFEEKDASDPGVGFPDTDEVPFRRDLPQKAARIVVRARLSEALSIVEELLADDSIG